MLSKSRVFFFQIKFKRKKLLLIFFFEIAYFDTLYSVYIWVLTYNNSNVGIYRGQTALK